MNQHQQSTTYSLRWAYTVYSEFAKVYPRATDILNDFYGIVPEMVSSWVAMNQKRWQNYKKIVKRLAQMEKDRRRRQPGSTIPLNDCVVVAVKSVLGTPIWADLPKKRLTKESE